MSLSNSTKMHLIDPTVNNTSRSKFHLPPGVLSSAIHLADFGVYSGQGGNSELYYPCRSGVIGAVKSIALYSGGQLLDEIQELPSWAAVQHMMTSNAYAEDINRFDLLNGTNATLDYSKGKYSYNDLLKDYASTYTLAAANAAVGSNAVYHNQLNIPTGDTGSSGIINLQRYMGLLDSAPVLPNIPDLNLVITWNLSASQFVNDPNATGGAANNPSFTNFRPTLVVEEILDAPVEADVKIPYYSVMVDRYSVPAVANGAAQDITLRTGNYRQRMLRDIILFNQPSTDIGTYKNYETSLAQYNEQIKLVVNDKNWLPENGIDNPAMKMRMFTDAMGSMNTNLVSYLPKLVDAGAVFADDDVVNNPSSKVNSTFSVAGVKIGTVIERLDINYKRTGANNADLPANNQTSAFTLVAFGRVTRLLELKNGKIRMSY